MPDVRSGDSVKALLLGDLHLSDRPPSLRHSTYVDEILDKVAWCVQLAASRKVDVIVSAGDVYHIKSPGRTTHRLVQRTHEVLTAAGIQVLITPGNHDLCVLDDHEALTDKGWRRVDELDGSEQFATLNPDTHVFEWQTPTKINAFQRTGEMLSFQSKGVDHVVTPNHDLYVNVGNSKKHLARGFHKRKAAEHPSYPWAWRSLTTAPGEWVGKTPETVQAGPFVFPARLAARFFGWYVSEGSVAEGSRYSTRVTISQSQEKSPAEWVEIEALLTDLGVPFVARKDGKAFRINSRGLAEFLADEFGSRGSEMHVPQWLMEWDLPELQEFLGAYHRGDSTQNGPSCRTARTCSQALADSMQALCARLGVTVTIGGWADFPYGGTDYVGRALTYSFKERQITALPVPEHIEVEDRVVWCPTVPNGIWMVRRNGKAVWTGNSHDRLDSLDSQPLGSLCRMEGIDLLIGGHESLPVFGLPYLSNWGADLYGWMEQWQEFADKHWLGQDEFPLLVTHAPIFPSDEDPPYETIDAADWAELMGKGACYYGHIHDQHGLYVPDPSQAVVLCNNGALSRGSLHEATLKRKPLVTIFDSEAKFPDMFEAIEVPHLPAEEVFSLAAKAESDGAQQKLTDFLTGLDAVHAESVEQVSHHIATLDVDKEVRTKAIELVEAAMGVHT